MKFSEIESYPIWSNNGNNEYNKIQQRVRGDTKRREGIVVGAIATVLMAWQCQRL